MVFYFAPVLLWIVLTIIIMLIAFPGTSFLIFLVILIIWLVLREGK